MSDTNVTTIIGRLGQQPELRYLPNNTPVVSFTLAVSDSWTKDGQKQERTNWIPCEAFGRPAEIINQYMDKGRRMSVVGKLRMDQWEQDGQKRSKLKVVVESFQFLDSKQDGGQHRITAPQQSNGGADDGFDDPQF